VQDAYREIIYEIPCPSVYQHVSSLKNTERLSIKFGARGSRLNVARRILFWLIFLYVKFISNLISFHKFYLSYENLEAQSVQRLGCGPNNLSSIPGSGNDVICFPPVPRPDWLRSPSSLLSNGYQGKVAIHIRLLARLGTSGATPPLPKYVFMAWCLIKNEVRLHIAVFISAGYALSFTLTLHNKIRPHKASKFDFIHFLTR
jgi:hypothetical protein